MEIPKLTYEYYFAEYCQGSGAAIPEESFDLAARRAREALSAIVGLGEPYGIENNAKISAAFLNTLCRMAEEVYRTESRGGVKSENIDGYSVTYSDSGAENLRARLWRIAAEGLSAYGLPCLGVAEC